ncbi:MAG: MBL fold metallo-hydrolase [Flavobacteriales bacterium]
MKKILKTIKKVMITSVSLVVVLVVATIFLVNCSPQFGGKVTKEQKATYTLASNYDEGKFLNEDPEAKVDMSFGNFFKMIKAYIKPNPHTIPEHNIAVEHVDSLTLTQTTEANLVWFGHSSFLLQLEGNNILLDPMFSEVPAPYPFLGNKRFSKELPIEIKKLPKIDAIILSHDHYDHLDFESIKQLNEKVEHFFVPLGISSHLKKWGVPAEKIHELNWWDEANFGNLTLACTPAQHFSGRGLTDGGNTLWSSWVIKTKSTNLFFSGDTGYNTHFTEIGNKYGPFDMALMECGQYNELWSKIHMMPEETAQAAKDVKANKFIPIHWGAFKLALHDWRDPIKRVSTKAKELDLNLISPKIGEMVSIHTVEPKEDMWWEKLK